MNKVRIFIPTLNAGNDFLPLLETLSKQSIRFELLIVDSGSTDKTVNLAHRFGAKVITISKRDFNHGGTRNLVLQGFQGDILVFLTQDVLPADNLWLEKLTAPIVSGEAEAAFARQQPKANAGPLEVFARTFNYPAISHLKTVSDIDRMGIKAFFFSNACSAVSQDAFCKVGGFPENTILNEDMMLAAKLLKAGYKVKYAANARVLHSHNYSIKQQFQRNFDIGVSIAQASELLDGARATGEGIKFVAGQLRYVVQNGKWWLVPRVLTESCAKLFAFQLGLREQFIPLWLKRRLSMHSAYWTSS